MTGSVGDIAAERIARQGLIRRAAATPVLAAGAAGGLQAQDPVAGRLGVRARSRAGDAEVLAALADGALVKTSLMRATIHLVPAADVGWLSALYGPVNARKFAKRWRDLGLTDQLLAGSAAALPEVLGDQALTRAEIVHALAERGIRIDVGEQASTHALFHATTRGLVCRGPDRGREATFVRLERWVPADPDAPRGDAALAELARRYFRAFAPATAADFATWSGLPATRAIRLIRDELDAVEVGGRPGFRLGPVEPAHGLCLLPAWDNYLVGYRDRSAIIDPEHRGVVYVGGVIKPTVVLDGRVVAIWRLTPPPSPTRDGPLDVVVERLPGRHAPSRRALSAGLDAEVEDLARFYAREVRLALCG